MGAPDALSSFGFKFFEEEVLRRDFGGASGVKGSMVALAVSAEKGGRRAATGDWFQVAILGAGAIRAAAAMSGVGVVFGAEGAGRVLLFACSVVVPEGETFGAVSRGRGVL